MTKKVALLIIAIISVFLFTACNQSDQDYINIVKDQKIENSDYTVDQLFSNYFKNPEWKHVEQDDEDMVEFTGLADINSKDDKVTFQYSVDVKNKTSIFNKATINDKPMPDLIYQVLLSKIFNKPVKEQ